MSRNIRNKTTKTVVTRKTKVTPSSLASDDDDYAGLDEISDSDDEEPDVELAEEQAIIASLANGSDEEDDADDESNDDDAPQPDQDDDDNESFKGFPDEPADFFNEQLPPTVRRRVRFDLDEEEVDYSSASDTDSGGFTFPDLMAEEDLDPKFRQQIQNDDNVDEDTLSETEWDWDNAAANYDNMNGNQILLDIDDEGDDYSSSDFDSDAGQTTEEDLPPPKSRNHFNPKRTVLRRREGDASSSSEEEVAITRTPRLGTWYNNGKESFAVTDHKSQKLMVFMAKTQRRHSFSAVQQTSQTQMPFTPGNESFSDMNQMIMTSPQDIMLGATNWMSSDAGFLMSPEAFTGSTSFSLNQVVHGSQPSSTTEEDLDGRTILEVDFGDFLHHDTSSDEDDAGSPSSMLVSSPSTARRPSTAHSMGSQGADNDLLSHLENVGVGAFRRNQNHHRLITRNNESHESLAFSTPTHEGTLRGVKHGKLAAVNTPMTPMRKNKAKMEMPEPTRVEKRKFGGETMNGIGHKRTRSMA